MYVVSVVVVVADEFCKRSQSLEGYHFGSSLIVCGRDFGGWHCFRRKYFSRYWFVFTRIVCCIMSYIYVYII